MSKGKWRIRIHTFFSFSSLKITRTISMNNTFNFYNTRNVYTKGLKCRLSSSLMFRLHTSVEPYTVSVAQKCCHVTEKAFTNSLKTERLSSLLNIIPSFGKIILLWNVSLYKFFWPAWYAKNVLWCYVELHT